MCIFHSTVLVLIFLYYLNVRQSFYLRAWTIKCCQPFSFSCSTSIYFYNRFFTVLFEGLRRLRLRTAINYSSRPNLFGSQQCNCFIIRFLTATSANPRNQTEQQQQALLSSNKMSKSNNNE